MDINKPLKDWEISCLAERMSPMEFDQIAVGFLGLTKIRLAQCRADAGNNCITFMANSLTNWREAQPPNLARQVLYSKLTKSADEGLIERRRFRFLVTGEEDENREHVHLEIRRRSCWKVFDEWRRANPFGYLMVLSLYQLLLCVLVVSTFTLLSDSLQFDEIMKGFLTHEGKYDLNIHGIAIYFFISSYLITGTVVEVVFIAKCILCFLQHTFNGQRITQRKLQIFNIISYCILTLMFLGYAVEIAYTLWTLKFHPIAKPVLHKAMVQSLDHYKWTIYPYNKAWDVLQRRYACCGVDNYTDWFNHYDRLSKSNDVPDSCCKSYAPQCGKNVSSTTQVHPHGCFSSLRSHIQDQVLLQTEPWHIPCWILMFIYVMSFWKTLLFTLRYYKEDIRAGNIENNNPIENVANIENNELPEELQAVVEIPEDQALLREQENEDDDPPDDLLDIVVHEQADDAAQNSEDGDDVGLIDLL